MFARITATNIQNKMFKGKAIILYGPRQVGKSTLVKNILNQYPDNSAYVDGEEFATQNLLMRPSVVELQNLYAGLKLLVIDEAQKIPNIGSTLKLLTDHLPNLQVIATGSSSFDLANKLSEPLTGRKFSYHLYPISLFELQKTKTNLEITKELQQYLIFGMYPEILTTPGADREKRLYELFDTYLYKDVLNFSGVLNQSILLRLLKLLAFQVGSEVSFHELGRQLDIDQRTVLRYITILEKAFVIVVLSAYSKNPRTEVVKKKKIYFWDNGVRNAIIQNLKMPDLRDDMGALWENFCVMERLKTQEYQQKIVHNYFWRSFGQKEIDFLEVQNQDITTLEFKFNPNKIPKIPNEFAKNYEYKEFKTISVNNWWELVK